MFPPRRNMINGSTKPYRVFRPKMSNKDRIPQKEEEEEDHPKSIGGFR